MCGFGSFLLWAQRRRDFWAPRNLKNFPIIIDRKSKMRKRGNLPKKGIFEWHAKRFAIRIRKHAKRSQYKTKSPNFVVFNWHHNFASFDQLAYVFQTHIEQCQGPYFDCNWQPSTLELVPWWPHSFCTAIGCVPLLHSSRFWCYGWNVDCAGAFSQLTCYNLWIHTVNDCARNGLAP